MRSTKAKPSSLWAVVGTSGVMTCVKCLGVWVSRASASAPRLAFPAPPKAGHCTDVSPGGGLQGYHPIYSSSSLAQRVINRVEGGA